MLKQEPSVVLPLWFWDTSRNEPAGVCTTEAELAGSIEWTDSQSEGYILLDSEGYRYVVETNDHLEIIWFERLDESPLDSSLELLSLMQKAYPLTASSASSPRGATFKERCKMLLNFLRKPK